MPNWELLTALASSKMGERVQVGPLAPEQKGKCLGIAGWDGSAYTVGLDPDLAERPAELLETFAHELAHLVLGHIGKGLPSTPPGALEAIVTPELAAKMAAARVAKEADADQWAERWVAQWEPLQRWALALACAAPE